MTDLDQLRGKSGTWTGIRSGHLMTPVFACWTGLRCNLEDSAAAVSSVISAACSRSAAIKRRALQLTAGTHNHAGPGLDSMLPETEYHCLVPVAVGASLHLEESAVIISPPV